MKSCISDENGSMIVQKLLLVMVTLVYLNLASVLAASSDDNYIWMKIEAENMIQGEPIRVLVHYVDNENFELHGNYIYHRSIDKNTKIIARLMEGQGDRGAFDIDPLDRREMDNIGAYGPWFVTMKKAGSRLSLEMNAFKEGKKPMKIYLNSEDIYIK